MTMHYVDLRQEHDLTMRLLHDYVQHELHLQLLHDQQAIHGRVTEQIQAAQFHVRHQEIRHGTH